MTDMSTESKHRRLTDILTHLADTAPTRPIFHFLYPDRQPQTITAGQLDHAARQIASDLLAQHITPDTILPLAFDHGFELVAAFWGAMYAGAVPTILPYLYADLPTQPSLAHIEQVVGFARAQAILTTATFESTLLQALAHTGCRVLTIPPLDQNIPVPDAECLPVESTLDMPYIQFSSGSTGLPKGVMLSHAAVLHYLAIAAQNVPPVDNEVVVGWLPLYHDMGLINQVFHAIHRGHESVMISPAHWLRQPESLFHAVSTYRGTLTWMPNFAFRYCLRRIRDEQLAGVDVSSWSMFGNGAEPVQIQDVEAFGERFAAYGLKRQALKIGYGLAEHVLGVCWTPSDRSAGVDWISESGLEENKAIPVEPSSRGSLAIVSCGVPFPTVSVRVLNDAGEPLPERSVGEIVLSSPCVFKGYYLLPDESAHALRGGWLHTGDVGYLADGELYVCGRIKDLMIVGGRNIHPMQLEGLVEEVLGSQCRFSAAFGVPNAELGTEAPVLVCEVRQAPDDSTGALMQQAVRERVQQDLRLFVNDVYFVAPGWIAKTTSGKINRTATRKKYLKARAVQVPPAQLPITAETSAQGSEIEPRLLAIWQKLFNRPTLNANDDFFALGGDSLLAIQLTLEVQERFGFNMSAAELLQAPTVATLAALIAQGKPATGLNQLAPLQPRSATANKPIFFCVHGLGGNVVVYKALADAMGTEQPFYCLQAVGQDGMFLEHETIDEMAAQYVHSVQTLQPHGPYYVGGYCFGGIVAFEIARQLGELGERVALVAILEGPAPATEGHPNGLLRRGRLALQAARNLPLWLYDYVKLRGPALQARNRHLKRLVHKEYLRLAHRPTEMEALDIDQEVRALPLPFQKVFASHVNAARRYAPSTYNGHVVLFRTRHQTLRVSDLDQGWGRLTTEPVRVELIAGTHNTILDEANVQDLAEKLGRYLT